MRECRAVWLEQVSESGMGIWKQGCCSSYGCNWKTTCVPVRSLQPCDLEYLVWRYEGEILCLTGNRCWSWCVSRDEHRLYAYWRESDRGGESKAIANSLLRRRELLISDATTGARKGEETNTFNFPRSANHVARDRTIYTNASRPATMADNDPTYCCPTNLLIGRNPLIWG